jgi:hypothetical protein
MQIHLDSDLRAFFEKTKSFLDQEKRLHSMLRGLIRRYLEIPKPMSLLSRMIDENGNLIALGIQTEPERTLIIPKLSEAIAENFAELLAARVERLPGANGPVPAVNAFAEKWAKRKLQQTKLCTNLRLFELKELVPAKAVSGFARLVENGDRDVIYRFMREFHDEAIPHESRQSTEDLYKGIDKGISQGIYFVWEDQGEVVTLLGSGRETEEEKWIAPVYTPPKFRGNGYASALTAHASQIILESGKVGMLFTDQSNPISNNIYQRLGYMPLADFKHIAFA